MPRASVLVFGDRIVAVEPGVINPAGAAIGVPLRTIDLEGRRLMPSFVDAHVHLKGWALDRQRIALAGETDHAAMVAKVRAYAATLAAPSWVLGGGWEEHRTGRLPHRDDLAGIALPVMLDSRDGHAVWCNAVALARAGIDGSTPDPPGGRIGRDAAGTPSGVLHETARRPVQRLVPPPTDDETDAALEGVFAELLRAGISEVHDCTFRDSESVWRDLARWDAAGRLPVRVAVAVAGDALDVALAAGLRTGFGTDRLRVGALKQLADGTLGSRTAAMEEPYCVGDSHGLMCIEPAELAENARLAAAGGIATWIHAIGDRCFRHALDALEAAEREVAGLPHRIEHAQLTPPSQLARAARLGVVLSVQPSHLLSDMDLATRHWGEERLGHAYAYGSMARAGVALAFGSDVPVEAAAPFAAVAAAVLRERPDGTPSGGFRPAERLDLAMALDAHTSGGAKAGPWRGEKGRIAPGQRADLVVVEPDPFEVATEELRACRVRQHLVAGRDAFGAD